MDFLLATIAALCYFTGHYSWAFWVVILAIANGLLAVGKSMTRGAMSNIAEKPAEYDFERTFNDLESAFDDRYKYNPSVASLHNPRAHPPIGVSAAKYLIDIFVLSKMKNRQAFLDDFNGFSSTVCATVGTAHRATEQLLQKVKIVG
jgi:hypothetical protein